MKLSQLLYLIIIIFLLNLLNTVGVFDGIFDKKLKEEINLQKISDDLNKGLPIELDVSTTWISTSVIDTNTILFTYEIQDFFHVDEKTSKLITIEGTTTNWKSLIKESLFLPLGLRSRPGPYK